MDLLEELYNDFVNQVELENNIKISLVDKQIIENENSRKGKIYSWFDANFVFHANILIDSSLSFEEKINVILHEYGHCIFYVKLGKNEQQTWRTFDLGSYDVENEYAAFKFQLSQIKLVAEKYGDIILQNTINELKGFQNSIDGPHKIALDKLFRELEK